MPHRSFPVMLVLFLLSAILLPALRPLSAQAAGSGPGDPAELEAFMDGVLAAEMSQNHVPGAVVVIVQDGQVLFSKGYGYADLEARRPVDPAKTLFRPGSVSKLLIWTSVMQLVEQGKLSLDTDVNEYLDFTIPATYPEPITLKTLLTHTPGFEDKGEDLFVLQPEKLISLEAYLKKNLPARVFPPGQVGAYSNYGAALAAYIVERVSGMSFYEYAEKNIFSPLEMTHATFRQPLPADLAADMSSAYNYVRGGYLKAGFEYIPAYPAGGLSASGLDMAKFMIAHLQNGRYGEAQILKEETARQMHGELYTPDRRIPGMAYGFFESELNGQRILSHGGATLLFHSGLYLLPDQNVGLFLSTNGTGGARIIDPVARAFLDHYYPVEKAVELLPAPDFASRAAKYIGEYHSSRSNFTGFEKVLTLFNPISITVDENNDVLLSEAGVTRRYVEVEPGLLVNREHPDERAVLKEVNGQISIHPSDPFVFIKNPWYGSLGLHLLILVGGAFLFGITLLRWLLAFLTGWLKHEPRPFLSGLARLTGGLFGLAYLIFLLGLLALLINIDPAYGVPNIFFGEASGFEILLGLPVLLLVLAVLMLPLAVVAWIRRFWTFGARLSYSFLTLLACAIVWSMLYWNLLRL